MVTPFCHLALSLGLITPGDVLGNKGRIGEIGGTARKKVGLLTPAMSGLTLG